MVMENLEIRPLSLHLGQPSNPWSFQMHATDSPMWCCGALVGCSCGCIRNGEIAIHGRIFKLSVNQGLHHPHGGFRGFDRKIWHIGSVSDYHATMGCESAGGEEGYPGNMHMSVIYRFSEAEADSDTVCNPTSHDGRGMYIASSKIAKRDEESLLTGAIRLVKDRSRIFVPGEESTTDSVNWRLRVLAMFPTVGRLQAVHAGYEKSNLDGNYTSLPLHRRFCFMGERLSEEMKWEKMG